MSIAEEIETNTLLWNVGIRQWFQGEAKRLATSGGYIYWSTLLADDPVLCGFRGPKLQIKRLFISRFNAAVLCQVIGVVDDCREKFGWGGWFVANVKMTDFIG